jgi:hypothetical protein
MAGDMRVHQPEILYNLLIFNGFKVMASGIRQRATKPKGGAGSLVRPSAQNRAFFIILHTCSTALSLTPDGPYLFPGALFIALEARVGIADFLYSEDIFLAYFGMGMREPMMRSNLD